MSIHRETAAPVPKRNRHAAKPGHARQSNSSQKMSSLLRKQNYRASEEVTSKAKLESRIRCGKKLLVTETTAEDGGTLFDGTGCDPNTIRWSQRGILPSTLSPGKMIERTANELVLKQILHDSRLTKACKSGVHPG